MCDIIKTERGRENPQEKGKYIMKNINTMSREELDKAIEEIEYDPAYISARMADRLDGAEKVWYEKRFNRLLDLYRARANKRTKEEYEELLANALEALSSVSRALAEETNASRKQTLKLTIADLEGTVENYRRKIAEAE
jgi:hypothetical protein